MPKKLILTFCALAASFLPKPGTLHAEDLNQAESLRLAESLHFKASDESLQNSTTNAMRALMDLANENRSAALSNAYKAYGQYRNSDALDNLRVDEKIKQIKLGSNSGAGGASSYEEYNTSYKRLNPKFLREGEAGKVAEEFERSSGMSRDDFLKVIAKASDLSLSPNDPEMVEKAFSRFETALKEVPNADFRVKVQTNINAVPRTVRAGLMSKAVQKIAQILAAFAPEKSHPAVNKPVASSLRKTASESRPIAGPVSEYQANNAREIQSTLALKPIRAGESGQMGPDKETLAAADSLGNIIQTALEEQKDETIFRQISKRYRMMAPFFSIR